jgi:uncharacterized membrane protein YhhN
MPLALVLTALGAAAALRLARLSARWPYALAKALAAAGFVAVAIVSGATASTYGALVMSGLLVSAAGDVALALSGRRAFVAGVGAFALAHLAYAVAFLVRGVSPAWLAVSGAVVASTALAGWRWLAPHLPAALRPAVAAYLAVIGVMLALAWAALPAGAPLVAPLGATAFFLSDVAVARERFLGRGTGEKLWGLPLYYLGQVLIALSVR